MLKKRKAQGLSINTIIVAIIGLIILVVLVLLLAGKLGTFSEGLDVATRCENICKTVGKDKGGVVGTGALTGKPACSVTGEQLVTATCCCKPKP